MRRLFAAYAAVTLVPVVLLGALVLVLLHRQGDRRGVAEGVVQAQLVARTAVSPLLDGSRLSALSHIETKRLRRSVESSVASGQVLRARLRTLRGVVVFTDAGSRGDSLRPDAEAARAARGETVARVTRLDDDDPGDASGPKVVEVYLPLTAAGSMRRIGVLELYLPYAPIGADIAEGRQTVAVCLAAGLVLLWLCLIGVTASVMRRLRRESAAHAHLAAHDALTGLANRSEFQKLAGAATATLRARPAGAGVGVGVLDLDRFRLVNDAVGHANADKLLIAVAGRLTTSLDGRGLVARLNGDEFGIVLHAMDKPREVAAVLGRLRDCLRAPFVIDGVPITVEASVGYSLADRHGPPTTTLLRRADIALTAAKREHRGLLAYASSQDAHDSAALGLVSQLRSAVASGQLVLHYQPKYDIDSGRITSVEALIRWQHPVRGLLSPAAFVDAVEQTELIDDLTRWVLRAACRGAEVLGTAGIDTVAVNISARCLARPDFADEAIALVSELHGDPRLLVLETTETAIMTDPPRVIQNLSRLDAAGFRISIDDFGAGQTSLGHLVSMPVYELKIDRAFVAPMLDDPRNEAVVRGVIDLGHGLGISVTAEGVESAEVLAALHELGCDVAQGYYLSRPLPLAEAMNFLEIGPLAPTA